jgi:hypothetical protein
VIPSLDLGRPSPDFINDEGVKWWHAESITLYASMREIKDAVGWKTELPSGEVNYVLTQGQKVLLESPGFEALGVKIDAYIALQGFN